MGGFLMAHPRLRLVAPATENRTVTPRRPKNSELRTREYLTADEVERLIEVAKTNRHGHRDAEEWHPKLAANYGRSAPVSATHILRL
jgi:hypothetical protein